MQEETSKKSLLVKYEIPVDHISFEFVEKCNDQKELEKIIKILRSGEEGHYPDLLKCTESRLQQIAPQSRILRTEEPILTKSTLGPNEWNKVSNEIQEWSNEMKTREETLLENIIDKPEIRDLPAIRKMKNKSTEEIHDHKSEVRIKRVVPRAYADWDKFDADKEILKMELEDERKKEQALKKNKQQEKEKKRSKREKDDVVSSAGNMSAAEKESIAAQEKDKGNDCYRIGEYEEAVKHYSTSIALCPTPTTYNNRAMSELKLQNYGAAFADCNQVLVAEPLNVKALVRRGIASESMANYEEALEDFTKALELEPENQFAKSWVNKIKSRCESDMKRVRMSIEDYSEGFVIPQPRPNIALNEWGLAKQMCTCTGTPAWIRRKTPRCRVCMKKRDAEKRAKLEEARKGLNLVNEDSSLTKQDESGVLQVTPSEENNINVNNDQMQVDEKGSGDMKTTEKTVKEDDDNYKFLSGKDKLRELDQNNKYQGIRENVEQTENMAIEINKLKDRNQTTEELLPTKGKEKEDNQHNMFTKNISELKQNAPLNIELNAVNKNTKKISTEINNTSVELNKAKCSVVSNNKKVQNTKSNESNEKKESSLRYSNHDVFENNGTKQKVSVANKYKKNSRIYQEDTKEKPSKEISISTPFEFVKTWQALKKDSDLSAHAEVLRAVSPANLKAILGNKLDGPMLSTILACLQTHFSPDVTLEYLNELILLPRFDVIVLFLENSERKAVYKLLKDFEDLGYHPSPTLKKAFIC